MLKNNEYSVLLLNAHWNNRGDEAAIRAMIDSFKSKLLIHNMEIMIQTQNVTQFPYEDINLIRMYPINLVDHIDSVITLLTLGKFSVTKKGKKFINSVNKADVVIHAPGGPSIGDMYGGKTKDYSYIYRLLIPIVKRKIVYFYAPSMGPFSNRLMNIFRHYVLKNADLIIVREEISAKLLDEQLKLDSLVTIDSALQNEIPENYIQEHPYNIEIVNILLNRKVVGLTITDLKWHPIYGKHDKLRTRIIDVISATIGYLNNKGYTILLIPQLFGEENDFSLLEVFRETNNDSVLILPENVDSYAQQLIISKLYCVIGMRYHSNIFAAKANVPFISIFYEHKMKGFMDELELTDLMINVEDISINNVKEKFEYIEENYNMIKNTLEIKTPHLKKIAQQTTNLIIDNLKSH